MAKPIVAKTHSDISSMVGGHRGLCAAAARVAGKSGLNGVSAVQIFYDIVPERLSWW